MVNIKTCLLLLVASVVAAANADDATSLRDACATKCTTQKDACSADCEEAMGMAIDTSFVTTCQTECARESEYCAAGCTVATPNAFYRSVSRWSVAPSRFSVASRWRSLCDSCDQFAPSPAQIGCCATAGNQEKWFHNDTAGRKHHSEAALVASQSWTNATDDIKDAITDQGNAVVDGSASDKLKLGPSASAVLSICAGIAVCFFGYRMLRPTMFLSGFLVGGFLTSSAIEYLFKNESWVDTAWWISLFVGGLLVGALVVALYSIGIFAVGAAGGVLLATMLNTSVGYKMFPENPNTGLFILAVILGLIGGILALKIEKPVIVVATSLVGAVLAISGVGYFAKNFPDITDLKQFATKNEEGEWVYSMPTVWWGYLAGMLALFLLGMLVQFKKTGSITHTRSNSSAKFEAKAAGYSHA
ncbi:hypothetical protein FI667_g783, partial [Globisporangium splendens]